MDRDKLAEKIKSFVSKDFKSKEICSKLKIDYNLFKNTCYKYNIDWVKEKKHARPVGAKDKKPRKSRKNYKKGGNDMKVLIQEGDLKVPFSINSFSDEKEQEINPFLIKTSKDNKNTDDFLSNIYKEINKPITSFEVQNIDLK